MKTNGLFTNIYIFDFLRYLTKIIVLSQTQIPMNTRINIHLLVVNQLEIVNELAFVTLPIAWVKPELNRVISFISTIIKMLMTVLYTAFTIINGKLQCFAIYFHTDNANCINANINKIGR